MAAITRGSVISASTRSGAPQRAQRLALAGDASLVSDWKLDNAGNIPVREVIANFRPKVLIGTSGQPGSFTEDLIRDMAAHTDRPALFARSNPTSKTEVSRADALTWTDGRALVATGSPFAPVEHAGTRHRIDQGDNVLCFPGNGFGVIACGARRVSDGMLLACRRPRRCL